MALCNRLRFFKSTSILNFNFSSSSIFSNKWRKEQGLEWNPRKYGPLINLPDYSFVDGRPVPLSLSQMRKRQRQEELCKRIVELTHEIDVGLEMYNERERQKKLEKEEIIKNKLKPKGDSLLQHKGSTVPKK